MLACTPCVLQGAAGAALGTAVAQYVALIPMLIKVNEKPLSSALHTTSSSQTAVLFLFLLSPSYQVGQTAEVRLDLRELVPSLKQYLSAATLVFARTWAKILAYAYCARQAALLGVSQPANQHRAHHIMLLLGNQGV